MTDAPKCPVCESSDVVPVPHTRYVRAKAEYLPEEAYLCELGHMFVEREENQVAALKVLSSAFA